MKRHKYYSSSVHRLFIPRPSSMLHEFVIPNILADENGLTKLANNKGLTILQQIREGATPPVVRVVRKIDPFVNMIECEELIKKIMRAFNIANIPVKNWHSAIILSDRDDIFFGVGRTNRGINRLTVTGTFTRTNNNTLTAKEIYATDSTVKMATAADVLCYRDKIDAENVWKIKLCLAPDYAQAYIGKATDMFIKEAKEILGAKDFQYRVHL